jgi:hypothetical protein
MSDVKLTAIGTDFPLALPFLDLLSQFKSLMVLVRDENDAVKVEFETFCIYRSINESYALDLIPPTAARDQRHWLYETDASPYLIDFRERNGHAAFPVKHYLIMTLDSIVDVISFEGPKVSRRTDRIRGWSLRPGEVVNLPGKDISELLLWSGP